MANQPHSMFIVVPVPYHRVRGLVLGQIIYSLNKLILHPIPVIAFSHTLPQSPSWTEFDLFPVSERGIHLFDKEPKWLKNMVYQESERTKRLCQERMLQQLQELSDSAWRFRCKQIKTFPLDLAKNREIMVGQVLEYISQGRESAHHTSIKWRWITGSGFSLDEFTSNRFLQRLEALHSHAQTLTKTLSKISDRLKKHSRLMRQSRLMQQNQLTIPMGNDDLSETEIVIDITFDEETHQPIKINSTVLPTRSTETHQLSKIGSTVLPTRSTETHQLSKIESTVLPTGSTLWRGSMATTPSLFSENTPRLISKFLTPSRLASK